MQHATLDALTHAEGYALFRLDPEGRFASWNAGAQRLLGYAEDEIVGRAGDVIFTPEDRAAGAPALELSTAIALGQASDDRWHVRKEGSRFFANGIVVPLYDDDGTILGFSKLMHDVTDRRRVEQTAQQQAQLLGLAHDAIIVCDMDNRITFWNRGAEELYGWSEAEAVGQVSWELLHTRFPTSLHDVMATIETTGSWDGELVHVCADGREIVVASRWALQRSETGEPLAILEINRDVTERRRDEMRLRFLADVGEILTTSLEYHATLQTVARLAVPILADWCAIDMVQADGSIQRVAVAHPDPSKVELAHELQRRYPDPPDAPAGVPKVIRTGEPELYPEIPDEMLAAVTQDAEHLRIARALGLKSGMAVPLMARGRILGAITFVAAESGRRYDESDLVFAQDLARRAGLAVDNARLHQATQAAIRDRDDVLTTVSHDLKTPLSAIFGMAQLLARRARSEQLGWVVDGLGRIEATTRRMADLIDELVDAARLRVGGEIKLRREALDLVGLATRAVDELQRVIDERHQLVLRSPPDSISGLWDGPRLRRVLDNLLDNAVKYSPDGGVIEVEVGREDTAAGPRALLRVRDCGVGIPAEDQPHIFEPGHRAANVAEIGGTGIGLAGACQIVRQHGGSIEVESVLDQGSTFTIALPLLPAPPAPRDTSAEPE